MDIVKIDGQSLNSEDFVLWLKFSGRFPQVVEDFVKEKLAASAARKAGVEAQVETLQQRADENRRALGLHRASDTNEFLDDAGATLDDYEAYLRDNLLASEIRSQVQSDAAVDSYFQLNSPKFDAVDVSHMVVVGESQANEIASLLREGDGSFAELAREHSVSDSSGQGGNIGTVYRSQLGADLEARIFHAEPGIPVGPFPVGEDQHFEIFVVNTKQAAALEGPTRETIEKQLFEEWLEAQSRTLQVQA